MALEHPNVLKIYDVFEDDGKFTIVLELIRGKELFDRIVERGCYSERVSRRFPPRCPVAPLDGSDISSP